VTNPLDKRELIREAAIQVIAQLGYHYATTDKIADQAGIAVGTIYNYFRNKDEILDYIFQVEVDKRYRCYNELASRDLPALEKMRQLLTMHFQEIMENPWVGQIMVRERYAPADRQRSGIKEFIEGVPEKLQGLLDEAAAKGEIRPGDRVIGLASSGLHSNGYSLARKALCEVGGFLLSDIPEGMDRPLGDEMLEPTRIYVRPVLALIERVEVLGMSHITGGGLVQNPPRILPHGASMALSVDTWRRPPIFDVISRTAGIEREEMFRVFNMGIGFLVITRRQDAERAVGFLVDHGEDARIIGEIVAGDGRVEFQGV